MLRMGLLSLAWIGLLGCAKGFQAVAPVTDLQFANKDPNANPPTPRPGPNPLPVPGPGPNPTPSPGPSPFPSPGSTPSPGTGSSEPSLGICSGLPFMGVSWPTGLTVLQKKALALSLDITGSFEGSSGWANISNNFDGQGMSLGLLQQNLGQGSLQPLLLKMNSQHLNVQAATFSKADLSSLQKMLAEWAMNSDFEFSAKSLEAEPLFPDRAALSPLDWSPSFTVFATSRNQDSVDWAVANLFEPGGSVFKSHWKNSFTKMALTPEYRSLQLESAMSLYNKARGYFTSFGFTQIRMMLLMFDFVTQNGGFNSTHLQQFTAYRASNPNASETARALKLLEIRLASVRDEYKDDVRARKTTIINGTGRVHGENRNLPNEYCFDPLQLFK